MIGISAIGIKVIPLNLLGVNMDLDKYNYNLSEFIIWVHENYNKARAVKCGLYGSEKRNGYYRYSMYYNGDAIIDGQINNIHGIFDTTEDTYVDIFHDRIIFGDERKYYCELDCTYFSNEPSEEELFQYSTIHEVPNVDRILLFDLISIAKKVDPEDL